MPVGDRMLVLHRFGRNVGSHGVFKQSDVPAGSILNSALIPFKGPRPDIPALYGGAFSLMQNLLFATGGTGALLGMSGVLSEVLANLLQTTISSDSVQRVQSSDKVWQNGGIVYDQVQTFDSFTTAKKFGSKANPKPSAKLRNCWSVNHSQAGHSLEPMALFVFQKPMCSVCYAFTVNHQIETVSKEQQLKRPLLTVDELHRNLTVGTREQFDTLCSRLKRVHMVACLDPRFSIPFMDAKQIELHGTKIAVNWFDFLHVYKERAVSLSIHLYWPMTALSLYWIASRGVQWRSRTVFTAVHAALEDDVTRHNLRNHGMAVMSDFDAEVKDGQLIPYVTHTKVKETGLMPWHAFVCVRGTWILSECVAVLVALKQGTIRISVIMAPAVALKRSDGRVHRGSAPGINAGKGKARIVYAAETITWGYLDNLMKANALTRPGKPLDVELVGSLCFAARDDGVDGVGGVFQSLCELALYPVDGLPISIAYSAKHGQLNKHASERNIDAIVTMLRYEKSVLTKTPALMSTVAETITKLALENGFGGTGLPRSVPTVSLHAIVADLGGVDIHAKRSYRTGTHRTIRTMVADMLKAGHLAPKDVSAANA